MTEESLIRLYFVSAVLHNQCTSRLIPDSGVSLSVNDDASSEWQGQYLASKTAEGDCWGCESVSSRYPMPCAAAHSVVRSFRNILPLLLPPPSPLPFSLSLSLLAIQQVDHRAYAAPSTVGPTQLPRVTSWLRGLLCNKSEFPRVSFRGSRVLRDFPHLSLSLFLFLCPAFFPPLSSSSLYTEYISGKSTTSRPSSREFWGVALYEGRRGESSRKSSNCINVVLM